MTRTIRYRLAAASIALAAVTSAAPQAVAQDAGEEVTLRHKFAAGDRWAFDEDMILKLKFKVLVKGKAPEALEQTNHKVRKGELAVLDAAGERLDAVRVRFGPECMDTEQAGAAEPKKKPTALASQTVVVRRQAQGDATVECAVTLSDDEKKEARESMEPTDGFFPKKPVKVGDRWVSTEKAIARAFGLGADDRGTLRMTLKALRDVDGRRTAEVAAALVVDQKQDYMKITLDLEGSLLIDVETGVAVGVDFRGPVTVSGETEQADAEGNPAKVTVEGGGECTYKNAARRLGVETESESAAVPRTPPPPAAAGKIDLKYVLPAGWEAKDQEDAVLLEKWENKGETTYGTERCFRILILPSQPLDGSLRKTFLDAWALQVKSISETTIVPLPLMRRLKSGLAVAYDVDGGAKNKKGVPIIVALHVLSQGKRVVPIIGIHSGWSDGLEKDLLALLESAEIPGAGAEKAALFDPADLAGVWNKSSYSIASYVAPGGGHAGDASISIDEKFTLNADGTFKYAFRGLRASGPAVVKDTEGKWKVDDESLVLSGKTEERYRLFGVGSDPKVGRFLAMSQAAAWAGGTQEQLEISNPRRPLSGAWYKRQD